MLAVTSWPGLRTLGAAITVTFMRSGMNSSTLIWREVSSTSLPVSTSSM